MKTEFYWHIHHDVLLEPLTEPITNRIKFIKENKPKSEIPLRLKLLKPVKGKLPEELVKVREACDKAWEAYDKAREAYDKARKAYEKALLKYKKEINKLHEIECPDCPWNGETIFSEEDK